MEGKVEALTGKFIIPELKELKEKVASLEKEIKELKELINKK
jgi:hypothetical protein